MSEKYSVVFSGRLREGETPDAVRVRLAELFRVRPEQLESLFVKAPVALRRGLDEATAAKWVAAVEKAGGLCWAEPERGEAEAAPKPAPVQAPPPATPVWEPAVSAPPPAPPPVVVSIAVPITEPVRQRKTNDVVPFPKCPRCGRLAESTEDHLMRTGVCPQCGLIIRKYASSFVTSDEGFWRRYSRDEGDRHWGAFWQSRLWSSYWRAAWYLCCVLVTLPALVRVLGLYSDDGAAPTIVQMAVSGIMLAACGWLVAVGGFYCFAVYLSSSHVFLIHMACSAGLCAVLAVFGGVLSFLSEAVRSLARWLRMSALMNPVRAAGFAAVAFFGIVLYFGLVRLPAEKRLAEYLDGPEYSARVSAALTLAGSDFPKGSRGDTYRYYRYVYVEPSRAVDPEFDRVLSRLLLDFHPSSFRRQHGPQVNLLVFNAIAFRDELFADGLVSAQTRLKLDQMAKEWERSRAESAARLVGALDTRSPIDPNDLHSLADRN